MSMHQQRLFRRKCFLLCGWVGKRLENVALTNLVFVHTSHQAVTRALWIRSPDRTEVIHRSTCTLTEVTEHSQM